MKIPFLISLYMFLFSAAFLQNSIQVKAENTYLLPDNREKDFISASEFLLIGNLNGYTEFEKADINFKQILLYKDVKKYIKSNITDYYYRNLVNI